MHTLRLPLLLGAVFLAGCTAMPPANNDTGSGDDIACAMEAKLCPDGSYVGRQGPRCEFAPCPGQTSLSGSTLIQTVSDGTITFSVPSEFGIAVKPEQLVITSYIPPCEEGYDYCLYYNAADYAGTNFASAGIGIVKRTDLTTGTACLNTQPSGYSNLTPVVRDSEGYTTSVFASLGDAAMGHVAQDRVYRLALSNACYEFRTRIGQSQFSNYPEGSIEEFTASDAAALQTELQAALETVTITNGEAILFPQVTSR
ncbi:hypothetical protein K8942_00500 [Candidatus Peribacteria bacterium]|nr:MAG: hypothetical protein K8942_00500 [Candidatus Peribacteria bacterium]